ncbi:MAG: hypothetical protein K6T81_10325, partial [Alicyclobacillus macrosporangiidus]|nr:hypothetical protein [Alicyclobacillus macrosporangiidus]
QAQSAGVTAKYLLFDSWFAYPSVILRVLTRHAMNVICMLKGMPHVYYEFEGRRVTFNHATETNRGVGILFEGYERHQGTRKACRS